MQLCPNIYLPFISHDEGLLIFNFLNLRFSSLNVQGLSILDSLDICCIQELWLQDYELDLLSSTYKEFHAWGITLPMHADHEFLVPHNCRGHGGIAILWWKTHSDLHKLSEFASHHYIGISVYNHLKFLPHTYLPTRSGCTDIDKEALNHLNVTREKYSDNGILYWNLARWSGSVGLVLFSSSARHSWHRNDLHSGWDSSRGVYAYGTAWSELFPDWKKA